MATPPRENQMWVLRNLRFSGIAQSSSVHGSRIWLWRGLGQNKSSFQILSSATLAAWTPTKGSVEHIYSLNRKDVVEHHEYRCGAIHGDRPSGQNVCGRSGKHRPIACYWRSEHCHQKSHVPVVVFLSCFWHELLLNLLCILPGRLGAFPCSAQCRCCHSLSSPSEELLRCRL